MRVETLLPLGKLDPGLRAAETPLDLGRVIEDARLVESLGYDGLAVEETKVDPYVVMALAAAGTTRLRLTTAVAMAFPRSPTITAMSAWNIQKLSRGRFVLGLGSQVRGHITRRFGLPYRPPGPWMRDYVRAVRAVWSGVAAADAARLREPALQPEPDGAALRSRADRAPGHPDPRGRGESRPCAASWARWPTACARIRCARRATSATSCCPRCGRARRAAGRSPALAVAMKPLICAAPDEATLAARVPDVRARVAFYASTPGYRAAFEVHGLGDLAAELAVLSRAQRWEEMPPRID